MWEVNEREETEEKDGGNAGDETGDIADADAEEITGVDKDDEEFELRLSCCCDLGLLSPGMMALIFNRGLLVFFGVAALTTTSRSFFSVTASALVCRSCFFFLAILLLFAALVLLLVL